jgi:hypothetical protein
VPAVDDLGDRVAADRYQDGRDELLAVAAGRAVERIRQPPGQPVEIGFLVSGLAKRA